jgi:hypothetical protein
MDIYLANLKEKMPPNIKQKSGLRVFFATDEMITPEIDETLVERDEEGNIAIDYREEPIVPQKKFVCKIIDNSKKSTINRDVLLKTMREKGLLPVVQKNKSQTSELAETVEIEQHDVGIVLGKKASDQPEEEEEEEDDQDEEEDDQDEEEDDQDEDQEEEDQEEESRKKVTINRKRKPVEKEVIALPKEVNPKEMIKGVSIEERLPVAYQHRLKTSSFYMNNRKKFISQLAPMFKTHKDELDKEDDGKPQTPKSGFSPMIHQKVVSDYLNLYTPYRGLLLFHGLGSGKTCSSIAIAEGMKSQKQIYVLTLASLKANFFNQLKECGDPIYKLDQFWEFISIEGRPDYVSLLSNILSIPESSIKKRKGAWMVNVTKESNFNGLSDEDKKLLNDQLDEMIRTKYIDVNYNGLLESNIDSKFNLPQGGFVKGQKNPFDDSVVVIDEVHNFVSMIVNKIRGNDKKSISYRLYEYLMSATNARIVLLSGTPIINYPNEIGVLFNI